MGSVSTPRRTPFEKYSTTGWLRGGINYICLKDKLNLGLYVYNIIPISPSGKYYSKGKTVVVVAHRLSTVRNADQIVVLEKGLVAEHGSHKELIAKKGANYNLVKNQLELGN